MKTTRLVIGVISMVFFIVVVFQSCAAGFVNTVSKAVEESGNTLRDYGLETSGREISTDDHSGTAGMALAFFMLIAGIVNVASRKSKAGGIVSGVIYLIAGLLGRAGITATTTYGDLRVWSVLCFIFGGVCLLGSIIFTKTEKKQKTIRVAESVQTQVSREEALAKLRAKMQQEQKES